MATNDMGVGNMQANLRAFQKAFPDRQGKALRKVSEVIATQAKRICPVYAGPVTKSSPKPGVLRASIHVVGPFREGNRVWCLIVAGGLAQAYALVQHETEWFHHEIGQWKYIETPIREAQPNMGALIAAAIREQSTGIYVSR